jgi:F-type H+-transporting ATPase subunit b
MSGAKTIAALVLALALSFSARITCGQESHQPQSSVSTVQAAPAAEAHGEAGQPENKKEAEADPAEAFRHSSSVKLVSRITGLGIDQAYWLCMVLNFAIIFAVLFMVFRKSVPAMFRNRTEAIQRRMEEARKTGEDARRRLAEVEARLSRLDQEIEAMRREADASGRQEEERVMAAAEEERRRIVESAEQEIARAANAARRELKAYAAELGVNLAEKKIHIAEQADQALVREFASRLSKDGNN